MSRRAASADPHPKNDKARAHARFLTRNEDGSARLRISFWGEQISLIEEAAGEEKIMEYIKRKVLEAAQHDVEAARAASALPGLPPPD